MFYMYGDHRLELIRQEDIAGVYIIGNEYSSHWAPVEPEWDQETNT